MTYVYIDPDPEGEIDQLIPEKQRRMKRVRLNQKHRQRDRCRKWFRRWDFVGNWVFGRRFEADYTFNRVQAPTALRNGIAYEKRPRKDLFRK